MRTANRIAGAALIGLSLYVILAARRFPDPPDNTPGPGLFPILVSVALILLVLLLLWESRREDDREPVIDLKSPHVRRALSVGGVLALYAFALPLIGFLVATPLALMGIMLIISREQLLLKGIATTLTTGMIYLVFHTLLQVPLP